MIMDKLNLFSFEKAITATTSSDAIEVIENVGMGEPIYIAVGVTTPFVGLTSLKFELQHSDSETTGFTTIAETEAVTMANLNKQDFIANFGSVPPITKKYLRLNYTVSGTPTAGAITAGLVLDRQTNFHG